MLNFGAPLFPAHVKRIQRLAGTVVEQVVDVDVRAIWDEEPLPPQVAALLDRIGVSPEEWKATSWLVHLPPSGAVAGIILIELYRRLDRFPSLLRLLPYGGVEVIDLSRAKMPISLSA